MSAGAGGWTAGSWVLHPTFPEYVVPADHAKRPVGFAADAAYDRAHYAQAICRVPRHETRRTRKECEANARLIAAAPDLYEALAALMEIETGDVDMDEFGDDESVGAYRDPETGEVKDLPLTFGHLRRARAALARARTTEAAS